jgi:hypothetical protein
MPNLALEIADKFVQLGLDMAHGERVVNGDRTVIPMALAAYCFGGGGGPDGSGSGGWGFALPTGALVVDDDGTHYEPNTVALVAGAVIIVGALSRLGIHITRAMRR